MRVSLIYPPQTNAYMPPLGVPTLTAILRKDDHDVMQYDYNAIFVDYILHKMAKEKQINLDFANVMRGKKGDFYDLTVLANSVNTFKTVMAQNSFTSGDEDWLSDKDIRQALNSKHTVLGSFIKSVILSDMAKFKPEVVGFSVIYPEQLIPMLIIAGRMKNEDPDLKIVVGGDYITSIKHGISANKGIFKNIDYFVLYEGEESLPLLLRCIRKRYGASNVPNLIDTRYQPLPAGKDYPTPDFRGFPLHLYLSPELVLPLLASRGRCYWGRCVFCSHHISHPSPFMPRSSASVIKDIKDYDNKYGVKHIFFNDNSFHPEQMQSLTDDIIKAGLHINFGCDTRFDKRYTFQALKRMGMAGCRLLVFGLESASQRILDAMKKGYNLKIVNRILDDCEKCGISTKVMAFLGFPGESRQDVIKTLKFVKSRPIGMLALTNAFILVEDTYIYDNAKKYGIIIMPHGLDDDLTQIRDYKCKGCFTPKKRMELLRRYKLLNSLKPIIGTIHYFLYACKRLA